MSMSDNDLGLPTSIPGLDGGSEVDYSDFAKGILNQIPEEDRPVVGKYIRDWDSNVTKQFQKIHEEYKPYKELGPADEVRNALAYIEMLNNDPVNFIKNVQEAMKEAGIMWENEGDDEKSVLPEYEGIPKAFIEKQQQLEARLAQLDEHFTGISQAQQEKEEQAALDGLLREMHTKHGDFDEDYVLLHIARGLEPDEAFNKYSEFVSKISSQKTIPPAPNLFRGSGNVPNGQVDPSKMSPSEKKALAVAALRAANAAAS